MDSSSPSQASGTISVLLPGKERHEATDFRVNGGQLELLNAEGIVLTHAINPHPQLLDFWSNEVDGPRTLAWISGVDIYRKGLRRHDQPIYSFSNQTIYEKFQSAVRQITFVKDFIADSIKPVGKGTTLRNTFNCNVKMWEIPGTTSRSISLPFAKDGGHITHEVLECAWLDLRRGEGKHANVIHLTFKSNRPRAGSSSHARAMSFISNAPSRFPRFRDMTRLGSWRGSRGADAPAVRDNASAEQALEMQEKAPPELSHHITEIVITFKESTTCLLFDEAVRPYLKPASPKPPSPTSPGIEQYELPRRVGSSGHVNGDRYRSPSLGGTSPTTTQSTPMTTAPPSFISHAPQNAAPEFVLQLPEPLLIPRPPASPPIGTGPGVFSSPSSESPLSIPITPSAGSQRERSSDAHIEPHRPQPSPNLTPQQQLDEIARYCSRQVDVAPIAKSARGRAQSNKEFYDVPLSAEDEIRLLHIMPGRAGELEVRLEGMLLAQAAGTYEALSYSWGNSSDLVGVTLENGHKREKKFLVSPHLDQALRRLRLVDEVRVVWVDAICINQADFKEMNHQVPLMGEIYRRAKRTIIWIAEFEKTVKETTCTRLFPAEDDTENSRTLCAQFDGTALEHGDLDTKLKSLLLEFHQQMEATGRGDAWYLRLWCVQEFHFSQKLPSVYLGQHAIGWHHFATIFKKVIGEYGPMTLFEQLRNQERRTMHGLCATTGAFRVSDPRDRIYSLLNMTDQHSMKVKPDYAKSILEVLEEVVLYLIHESQTVDVLLDKRCDRTFGDGYGAGVLPTYMPDFTQLQPASMTQGIDKYYTGNKKAPVVEFKEDYEHDDLPLMPGTIIPRLLCITAIKFDSIKYFTTVDDVPQHETSPSGALIYNSLCKPGELIKKILEALHFKWEANMTKWELDRTPKIGRLILEFLFEEQRNHLDELSRCNDRSGTNLKALFTAQAAADRIYVQKEDEIEGNRDFSDDLDYIDRHWNERMTYISSERKGRLDVTKILDQEQDPWREALSYDISVCRDFQAATEFENLFCYARRTYNKYYFSALDYDQPMRRNVLNAKTMEDIQELETEFGRDSQFELHEYSDKARQRDFFATAGGFVGLGPTGMRQGDALVVPYSASRPFVLRPCPGKDSYTLVGEAVLPGIMHGQWITTREERAKSYELR